MQVNEFHKRTQTYQPSDGGQSTTHGSGCDLWYSTLLQSLGIGSPTGRMNASRYNLTKHTVSHYCEERRTQSSFCAVVPQHASGGQEDSLVGHAVPNPTAYPHGGP